MEVMVSLALFSILMVATSQIFASSFSSYRNTRSIQKDIENAQYILNAIAKELRTGSVVSPNSPGNVSVIQFFDHSQDLCIRYQITGGNLQVAKSSASDVATCNSMTLSSFATISTGTVTGSFSVVPTDSSSNTIGKVTLSLRIQETSVHSATIQTTTSLRDYGTAGF